MSSCFYAPAPFTPAALAPFHRTFVARLWSLLLFPSEAMRACDLKQLMRFACLTALYLSPASLQPQPLALACAAGCQDPCRATRHEHSSHGNPACPSTLASNHVLNEAKTILDTHSWSPARRYNRLFVHVRLLAAHACVMQEGRTSDASLKLAVLEFGLSYSGMSSPSRHIEG